MEKDIDLAVYCAIIQFHSDRAIASASFLIASIFGLFVVLSLMPSKLLDFSSIKGLSLAITYWFLWVFGLYALMNFGYYASNAQAALDKIKLRNCTNLENEILVAAYNRTSSKWFHRFKRAQDEDLKIRRITLLRSAKSLLLFPSYIVFVGILPFIAVNEIFSPIQVAIVVPAIYVGSVLGMYGMRKVRSRNRDS